MKYVGYILKETNETLLVETCDGAKAALFSKELADHISRGDKKYVELTGDHCFIREVIIT